MSTILIQFDGACSNNGRSNAKGSYGWVAFHEDGTQAGHGQGWCSGERHSNNIAEYQALIKALEWLVQSGLRPDKVIIEGDSKLVINCVMGRWKTNMIHLRLLRSEVRGLLADLECPCHFRWIPRWKNQLCDDLSKTPDFRRTP